VFLFLLAVLIATPLIELSLLVRVAHAASWETTIFLVVATGVIGASLARRQGLNTWLKVQSDLARGEIPTAEIVDGVLIFIAGLVLLTPGFITDGIGFALLIPPVRRFVRRKAGAYFSARAVILQQGGIKPVNEQFIDVQPIRTADPDSRSELP